MRLGGFVIHGNSAPTLGAALRSLTATCDVVVAVDSLSTDGSAELVRAAGAEAVRKRWEGYGAARAAAVDALVARGCDWVFFLDSDEWLEPEAEAALRAWRAREPAAPVATVRRRNWVLLDGAHFVYRTDTRARLARRDAAVWSPRMVVHEALPPGPRARAEGVVVEHRYVETLERRRAKDAHYALLWAVQALEAGRTPKPAVLQRWAHLAGDLLLRGALLRGGTRAARVAWEVAGYHALKAEALRALRRGEHAQLVAAYREGRLADLFQAPGA